MADEKIDKIHRDLYGNGYPDKGLILEHREVHAWAFGDPRRGREGANDLLQTHDKMLKEMRESQKIREAEIRVLKRTLYVVLAVLSVGIPSLGVGMRSMMEMLRALLGG